jgi:hypothetical protein
VVTTDKAVANNLDVIILVVIVASVPIAVLRKPSATTMRWHDYKNGGGVRGEGAGQK